MEGETPNKKDQTTAWIAALAIAIICCAMIFVLFAYYFVAINKNLAMANTRLTTMEENESQLLYEIQSLHRAIMANSQNGAQPPKAAPQEATLPKPPAEPGPQPSPPTSRGAVPEVPPMTH